MLQHHWLVTSFQPGGNDVYRMLEGVVIDDTDLFQPKLQERENFYKAEIRAAIGKRASLAGAHAHLNALRTYVSAPSTAAITLIWESHSATRRRPAERWKFECDSQRLPARLGGGEWGLSEIRCSCLWHV